MVYSVRAASKLALPLSECPSSLAMAPSAPPPPPNPALCSVLTPLSLGGVRTEETCLGCLPGELQVSAEHLEGPEVQPMTHGVGGPDPAKIMPRTQEPPGISPSPKAVFGEHTGDEVGATKGL